MAGSISSHAAPIWHSVDRWTPAPEPTIVPLILEAIERARALRRVAVRRINPAYTSAVPSSDPRMGLNGPAAGGNP